MLGDARLSQVFADKMLGKLQYVVDFSHCLSIIVEATALEMV